MSYAGYLYGLGAYTLWGIFPAYFKLLQPSGAIEVLSHRIAWSLLFMIAVLTAVRRWRNIVALLHKPATVAVVALAAVLLALNWGTYIYGVNTNRVVETSLGYFINPLVVIVLGVVMLGERLRPAQWTAVGVGALAVLVLAVGLGQLPWIALILAVSFGFYGLVKKRLGLPPTDGLFVESTVLALPALAVLGWLAFAHETTVGTVSTVHTLLIVASGAITAIPLLLFAGAANRIPMVGLGMLQYVAPTLQLALGVFLFHEPMPPVRLFGFGLVWVALAIFTWDGVRNSRRTRALDVAAAQEGAILAGAATRA